MLYDFAGFDGLPVAKALFGGAIDRTAPFQSVDVKLSHENLPCTVLRLCENNFRVKLPDVERERFATAFRAAQSHYRVWLKQFDWLTSLTLPDATLNLEAIMPKPPHRIAGLQPNCAAIGRIDGIAVLVWRHFADQSLTPIVELHFAKQDLEQLQSSLLSLKNSTCQTQGMQEIMG